MRRNSKEYLQYCTRAVIQYLSGNMKLFHMYTNKAIQIYKDERNMYSPIREMVPKEIREKLYEMVD